MTAPDARQSDELREALARAFADGVAMRRQMEPLTDRQWAIARAAWEDDIAPLLPVVTAWAETQARARAAEEIEWVADERAWTTEHDNEVVSTRELYEQVARLRGELEPVTFDFPPDAALTADDRTDAR